MGLWKWLGNPHSTEHINQCKKEEESLKKRSLRVNTWPRYRLTLSQSWQQNYLVGTKIQNEVKHSYARTIKEHLEVSRFIHQTGQQHLKVSVATPPSLVTIGTTVMVGAVAQICLDDCARTTLAVIETSQSLQDSWHEGKIQTKCEDLAHNACNICLWSVYIKTKKSSKKLGR